MTFSEQELEVLRERATLLAMPVPSFAKEKNYFKDITVFARIFVFAHHYLHQLQDSFVDERENTPVKARNKVRLQLTNPEIVAALLPIILETDGSFLDYRNQRLILQIIKTKHKPLLMVEMQETITAFQMICGAHEEGSDHISHQSNTSLSDTGLGNT